MLLPRKSKLEIAQRGASQGEDFFKLTQALEKGGEVAHSDVIRAELQMQDRHRQLQEAQLDLLNAKLELAVLIFPDFNDNFEISDDLHASVPCQPWKKFNNKAPRTTRNCARRWQEYSKPAMTLRTPGPATFLRWASTISTESIRPQFAANSVIDNQKFPTSDPRRLRPLNIPVWNWGATQSRGKASRASASTGAARAFAGAAQAACGHALVIRRSGKQR